MFAEGWGEPPKRYTVWAGRDVGERASGSQWFTRRLDKPRAARAISLRRGMAGTCGTHSPSRARNSPFRSRSPPRRAGARSARKLRARGRAAGHAPRARTARQRPLDRGPAASDRSIAVPPAQLSRRARAALWLFRIFALVVSFLVIYTFVSQLH